ncbi:hypothetical protein I316_00904 [Kwoniella heveanensis BCC8398]|uniref:Uncharacterized protein n=1 Tax=Kwoniella heveanensis BCC8398 TaxID=1296120 RepID=A0A1B9H171_9TREE|nr:hypothetical protein I316_00904 [Kwoniella heveanensis BCC8398]
MSNQFPPRPQTASSSSPPSSSMPAPPSQPSSSPSSSTPPNVLKALSRSPEKQYTGPSRSSLSPPRSKVEAERYFAKLGGGAQGETLLPTRGSKLLGVGGWLLGGSHEVWSACSAIPSFPSQCLFE